MTIIAKQPKSRCYCGHTGDGRNSEHAGLIGHGACLRCACAKFTWEKFLPYGKCLIKKMSGKL